LTYCAYKKNGQTAPGQIDIEQFLSLYRVKTITDKTKLYGLIGRDISHSLSAYYYNMNFKSLGLNCVYIPIDTISINNLRDFIRTLGFSGFSITSPYKNKLNKIITNYDKLTECLKVVNTIVIKGNKVYAYNTDLTAFIKIIGRIKKTKKINNVLVLGSGSMAKVVIYALKNIFYIKNVYTYCRSKEVPLNIIFSQKYDLLINASKFGMINNDNSFYDKVLQLISEDTIVIELNYKIIDTPIISTAKRYCCTYYTGIDFFKEQFKEQFKLLMRKPPIFT
ncbi:MAG: shikimate dehydrogenase family protein, partial [Planctomycetota bacterium]